MEAGADDQPYAEGYADGYVCSFKCEQLDKLDSASPSTDWRAILDAALNLNDLGHLTTLSIHRASCDPVVCVPLSYGRFEYLLGRFEELLVEDCPSGDERVVLLGMVDRIEVVE